MLGRNLQMIDLFAPKKTFGIKFVFVTSSLYANAKGSLTSNWSFRKEPDSKQCEQADKNKSTKKYAMKNGELETDFKIKNPDPIVIALLDPSSC